MTPMQAPAVKYVCGIALAAALLHCAAPVAAQDMAPVLAGMGFMQGVVEREAARQAAAEAQRARDESALNLRAMQGALAMDAEGLVYGTAVESIEQGRTAEQFSTSTMPRAMQACQAQQPRTPCRPVTGFNSECLAIAWSANSLHAFWQSAFMLRAAEEFAMKKCEKGGGNCRLVTTQCALSQNGRQALGQRQSGATLPNSAEMARIQAQPPALGFFIADAKPTVLLASVGNPYSGQPLTQLKPVQFLSLISANRDQGLAVLANAAIAKLPVHMFANTCAAVAVPDTIRSAADLVFASAPTPEQAAIEAEELCRHVRQSGCSVGQFTQEQSCSGNFVRLQAQETASGPVFGAIAVDRGLNGVSVVINQTSRAAARQSVENGPHFVAAFNPAQRASAQAAANAQPKLGTLTFANACAGVAVPKAGIKSSSDIFLFTDDSIGSAAEGAISRCQAVTNQPCRVLKIRQEKVCSGDFTKALMFASDLKDYQ